MKPDAWCQVIPASLGTSGCAQTLVPAYIVCTVWSTKLSDSFPLHLTSSWRWPVSNCMRTTWLCNTQQVISSTFFFAGSDAVSQPVQHQYSRR